MKKLREKKGGTEIIEVLIMFTLITFVVFFPLASFSISQRVNFLEDSKILALQLTSREGGVTPAVVTLVKKDLQTKGFDSSTAIVRSINADGTVGKPLINRASNTPIQIEIFVSAQGDMTFLKVLWGMVGLKPGASGYAFGRASSKYFYFTKGFVLSEKP